MSRANTKKVNRIGDEGAIAIAQFLQENKTLIQLYLAGTFYFFSSPGSLLTLQDNKIGNLGAQELAQTLRVNQIIETLDLVGLFFYLRIFGRFWQIIFFAWV
jgi:polyferredoxin